MPKKNGTGEYIDNLELPKDTPTDRIPQSHTREMQALKATFSVGIIVTTGIVAAYISTATAQVCGSAPWASYVPWIYLALTAVPMVTAHRKFERLQHASPVTSHIRMFMLSCLLTLAAAPGMIVYLLSWCATLLGHTGSAKDVARSPSPESRDGFAWLQLRHTW